MTPDRRRRYLGGAVTQTLGALVMTALIIGVAALGDAPVWVAVAVAGAVAGLLALRWWGDHRRGRRWF
jgi:hypothetical protein